MDLLLLRFLRNLDFCFMTSGLHATNQSEQRHDRKVRGRR
jgi:hypothetical protein